VKELLEVTTTEDGWERVISHYTNRTERLKVPGGWIYRCILSVTRAPVMSLVFVPERNDASD
jgi:hypothetical protein